MSAFCESPQLAAVEQASEAIKLQTPCPFGIRTVLGASALYAALMSIQTKVVQNAARVGGDCDSRRRESLGTKYIDEFIFVPCSESRQ